MSSAANVNQNNEESSNGSQTPKATALQIKFKPVNSSILEGYNYDTSNYILFVQFKGGSVWQYYNVFPDVISQVFDNGGSSGSNFVRLIKRSGYLGQKLV